MLPTITTERLTLRPYQARDAKRVQTLAGEKIMADMTANIPHPYEDGMAESWIANHRDWYETGRAVALAIELTDTAELIGTVSLTQINNGVGFLGYWVGVPYWGQGFCTEASEALIEFGFAKLSLESVKARHLKTNPASARVIEKTGFYYLYDRKLGEREIREYELTKLQWLAA